MLQKGFSQTAIAIMMGMYNLVSPTITKRSLAVLDTKKTVCKVINTVKTTFAKCTKFLLRWLQYYIVT